MKNSHVTGVERTFDKNEIIVSKTDLKGRITYVNRVFMTLADYTEKDLLDQPHSIIRHPEMPRCVFKLLWDTIEKDKKEIFAYVINRSANGDHYWVLAHVTPSFDEGGNIVGYHSNRRVPDRRVLNDTIVPLYKKLLDEENSHKNAKEGMNSAYQMLVALLEEKGVGYDELIFSLSNAA
ncbi:MAG TPA: PAS domain-containing protein [Alphaproteobacteria bacterium]|nr:PAS domain-containing protein [Alphaproteobacteria bacterium]USO05516.1 MAG: PAS domain-containing protein [Rhodospirillales bacterium]HOO82012.1 PAS domain-containing protein [Alphaproteobacteria bacterium]